MQLKRAIDNGHHTVLIAPRRYGKTSLMRKVTEENNYPFIVENGAGIFWPSGSLDIEILHKNPVLQKQVAQQWLNDFQYMSLSPVLIPDILQLAQTYK